MADRYWNDGRKKSHRMKIREVEREKVRSKKREREMNWVPGVRRERKTEKIESNRMGIYLPKLQNLKANERIREFLALLYKIRTISKMN